MRKILVKILFFTVIISCSSSKSFQSFFNDHKNDIGITAFQVPNFLKALLGSLSPEMGGVLNNIQDFKFMTFNKISETKKAQLISEINLVTANNYTDMLRVNIPKKTKILSVVEAGDVVKKAIIFNSSTEKTSVFYLKGNFDPNKLRQISETNQFENLSNKLIQQYQSPNLVPGFNPNQQ